jgi:hypothetical protein
MLLLSRFFQKKNKQKDENSQQNSNRYHTFIYARVLKLQTPWWCSPATQHGGAWGERRYSSYSFLTSVLDEVCGQRHAPAAPCPGERTPAAHCTGGWVGFRAGLDTEARGKILCYCRGSNPDSPVVQPVDTILTELPGSSACLPMPFYVIDIIYIHLQSEYVAKQATRIQLYAHDWDFNKSLFFFRFYEKQRMERCVVNTLRQKEEEKS